MSNATDVVVGAIRWDAWYAVDASGVPGQSRLAVEKSLGPNQFHSRAPFFGIASDGTMSFAGASQATMDAEIGYAVSAGVSYFAFGWGGQASTMSQAWKYFQSSSVKSKINWCFLWGSFASFSDDVTNNLSAIVGYLQQANYQTVGGRPLVFVLDHAGDAGMVTAFRTAVTNAGMPSPYMVIMAAVELGGATQMAQFGYDAVSIYSRSGSPNFSPYSDLDTFTRGYWNTMASYGVPMIPTGMLGWNPTPRIVNPVPWEPDQLPGVGLNLVYDEPTPTEVTTHLQALVEWVAAHRSLCVANHAMLYAWDEHDEGGYLNPLFASAGVDVSRLPAAATATKPVVSDVVDYLLKYADQTTAKAALPTYVNSDGTWRAQYAIPNVKVWLASQDVGGVHTFQTGFFVYLSVRASDATLLASTALQIAISRPLAGTGKAGMVVKSNLGASLQDVRIAPVFTGGNIPFGSLQ